MAETDLLWMSAVVFIPSRLRPGVDLRAARQGRDHALAVAVRHRPDAGRQHWHVHRLLQRHHRFQQRARRRSEQPTNASRSIIAWHRSERRFASIEQAHDRDWLSSYPWIERFNIDYYLGTDGISMPLVLLTTRAVLPGHDRQLEDRQASCAATACSSCSWKRACSARSWRWTSSCSTSSGK